MELTYECIKHGWFKDRCEKENKCCDHGIQLTVTCEQCEQCESNK